MLGEGVRHHSVSMCFRFAPSSGRPQSVFLSALMLVVELGSSYASFFFFFLLPSSHLLQIAPLALLSFQLWVKHHPLHQYWGGWILAHALMDFGCVSALQV